MTVWGNAAVAYKITKAGQQNNKCWHQKRHNEELYSVFSFYQCCISTECFRSHKNIVQMPSWLVCFHEYCLNPKFESCSPTAAATANRWGWTDTKRNEVADAKINTDLEQWPQSVSALSEKINRCLVKFTSMSLGFAQTFCSWHVAKLEIETSGSQSVALWWQGWTMSFRNTTKLKSSTPKMLLRKMVAVVWG